MSMLLVLQTPKMFQLMLECEKKRPNWSDSHTGTKTTSFEKNTEKKQKFPFKYWQIQAYCPCMWSAWRHSGVNDLAGTGQRFTVRAAFGGGWPLTRSLMRARRQTLVVHKRIIKVIAPVRLVVRLILIFQTLPSYSSPQWASWHESAH